MPAARSSHQCVLFHGVYGGGEFGLRGHASRRAGAFPYAANRFSGGVERSVGASAPLVEQSEHFEQFGRDFDAGCGCASSG